MNDDLTVLGEALERAVATRIASDRNISMSEWACNRRPHQRVIEEDPMLTDPTHASHGDRPRRARRSRRRRRRRC